MPVIRSLAEWSHRPDDAPRVPRLRRVMLGDPAAFDIAVAINAHMRAADGSLLTVDRDLARTQWRAMADAYQAIGSEVRVLPPAPDLPDLCFTANPSMVLPLPDGSAEIWAAHMAHPSRAGEVPHHLRFAERAGLPVRTLPESVERFEGTGDGILHPERFVLHAGVGARTSASAWDHVSAAHPDLDVLIYKLVDDRFYHLDTALAALTPTCALVANEALDEHGRAFAKAAFPDLIEVPLAEALLFAANAYSPDGQHVLIEAACEQTIAQLESRDFKPVPLATSEFRKSGGSVFCMKQAW